MRRSTQFIPLILLAVATGCSTQIRTDPIRPTLSRIISRHDAYVHADITLGPAPRQATLAQSAYLAGQLAGPTMPSTASGVFDLVAVRHDAYVNADPKLDDLHRRVDLRDTALIRQIFHPTTNPAP